MGLVLLGADNLASDQADQNPSVFSRPKQAGRVPGKGWFEVLDRDATNVTVIFHNFVEWPTDEWAAELSRIASENKRIQVVDMRPCAVKEIVASAFTNLRFSLTKVYLPETLETVRGDAFSQCKYLKIDRLPESLAVVERYAFYYVDLSSITALPKSLYRVGNVAFLTTNLSIDLLPKTITELGRSSFSISGENLEIACPSLEDVGHPGNVSEIKGNNLKTVWIRSSCDEIPVEPALWPFDTNQQDLVIYAEPDSKPEGWGEYFNRVWYMPGGPSGSSYYDAQVIWGQKTRPF